MKPTGPYCSVSYFLRPWHLLLHLLHCVCGAFIYLLHFFLFVFSWAWRKKGSNFLGTRKHARCKEKGVVYDWMWGS